jgi:phenylpyruvate tautomerase PptA (4-oxalocrotonate tautomerase family)
MPLVRITLLKGRTAAQLRAIANGVHEALAATFTVPTDDRFQIIEQLEPGSIIYNAGYLGVERTDGIVLIHITASNSRDTAAKQALYRAIVDNLAADPGIRCEDVQIILSPNDRADWSFGNGVAPYVPTTPGEESRP